VVYIRLSGQEKFAALAAELKGPANKRMRLALGKAIRTAVKPAMEDVRATVRTLPVTSSSKGTSAAHGRATKRVAERGLRAAVAASVHTKVYYGRADVQIVVTPLGGNQKNLPKDLNKSSGWKHPVFGHRDRQTIQAGRPYFEVRILTHRPGIQAEVERALDATAQQIAAAIRAGR
jgi:hypothetical protein